MEPLVLFSQYILWYCLLIITYLIYQQSYITEDGSMLDQLSFRLNEGTIISSYLEVAKRIESFERLSPFIKRLKQNPGKAKLFLE